jgi:outer membrane protein assembly factor BamB
MRKLMVWLFRVIVAVVVLAALAGLAAWLLGWRVQLDGSGQPHLTRVVPPTLLADLVETHRASQPAVSGTTTDRTSGPQSAATALADAGQGERPGDVVRSADRAVATAAPYWTGFRGPLRDGHYQEQAIRVDWPATGLVPMWKQPAGGGYASFSVANGRAVTIEQRRAQEVVAAYDIATGRELWAHAWDASFEEWMGGDGPRATPTWFDGRVYALGAEGELRVLDAGNGNLVWRVNILEDAAASNLQWGMAASPLVFDDLVVVHPGGRASQSVVAYDRHTGTRRWAALDDQAAYSSPVLTTMAGVRQILLVTASRLVSLEPHTGDLLWSHPWPGPNNGITAAQPLLVGADRVMLSSGYGMGAALVEIRHAGGSWTTREVWRNNRLKNRFSSSVLHEGHIYGLDETILTCLDAATGDVRWKAGRYGHGQVVLANGHLIVLTEDGDLALVRATPGEHDELVRFSVLDGKTWNHPVIDRGVLLVRNLAEMAAFDLRVR